MSEENKRGFYSFQQPWSKTQPAKASDPSKGDMSGSKNTEHRDLQGGQHDFNYKGKVTKMGDTFHNFGKPQSGLNGNFSDKDASNEYLRDRGLKGQRVKNYSGGNPQSIMHTNNIGVTAYNSNPINEVYRPATSNRVPSADPVVRPQIEKEETANASDQSNLTKKAKK